MPITGTQRAPTYARLGVGRLGATRLDYAQPIYRFVIDGVLVESPAKIAVDGWSISDQLDGTPNTATLKCQGFTPSYGSEVLIYRSDRRPSHLEFAGHILNLTAARLDTSSLVQWDCNLISYEWLLNARKVTARYMSMSATDIAIAIIEDFTDGFSTAGVQADLESLDEFTLTNEDVTQALDRLKDRIGAHWVVDYSKVLHFGTDLQPGSSAVHAITDTAGHGMAVNAAVTWDLSQVKTRALGEAGGAQAAVEVAVGETILPVEDPGWYQPDGGWVVSGPQRINYTGVQEGGAGALVGSFAVPTNAPTVTQVLGGSLTAGVYSYAETFFDGTGETPPGPTVSITLTGAVTPPSTIGTLSDGPGGSMPSDTWLVRYTFVDASGTYETTSSPTSNAGTTSGGQRLELTKAGTQTPPAGFTYRFYRSDDGGVSWRRFTGWSDDGTYYYWQSDSNAAFSPPATNTAIYGTIQVENIGLGPTGTTGRYLYRTAINASQLKRVTTINNNTSTGPFTDTVADGSLGANVPTTNTSGLVTVTATGTVLAGSTTIPITASGPFVAAGGWAGAGNQAVRYTGTTATTLTGVPATGPGSLEGSLNYGTAITAMPMLVGIPASGAGAIVHSIAKGDDVNLWVIRDDVAAQTALGALLSTPTHTHDGVIEDVIQDRRLSYDEMVARLDALLLERRDPIVSLRYPTLDQTTRSGRDVSFQKTVLGIPTPQTFKIQSVAITDFDPHPTHPNRPWRTVDASSRRFSLEDLLRIVKAN
jgi:hypothetical protein